MPKEQCPSCFGRGYKPEGRKSGMGFYARHCSRCNGSGEVTYSAFKLYWSPTAQLIGEVRAKTAAAARRKAPAPYRKYLGEIRAELVD